MREKRFRDDFIEFIGKDDPTADDYLKMFITASVVTRQGSGLLFEDLAKIIKDELKRKNDNSQKCEGISI